MNSIGDNYLHYLQLTLNVRVTKPIKVTSECQELCNRVGSKWRVDPLTVV